MEGVDAIYWINLKRAKERRIHMEKMLKDPAFDSIEKIRVEAVDAYHANKYFTIPRENHLSINARVNEKEYACLASHLNAIRMFSKSKFKTAIIFEDDVSLELKPYWKKTLQQVMEEAPKDWEILKLYDMEVNQKETYSKLSYPCYQPKHNTNTTCRWVIAAYLIHKRAALKLMRLWNGKTYQLPAKTFHVADYLLHDRLTTYVYKHYYFMIRKNNDTQIQPHARRTMNNRMRRILLSNMKRTRRR